MEGWLDGGQSSPSEEPCDVLTAWSRRSYVVQPVSRTSGRGHPVGRPGQEAQDPRSCATAPVPPPAIPTTGAGGGFARPHPARCPMPGGRAYPGRRWRGLATRAKPRPPAPLPATGSGPCPRGLEMPAEEFFLDGVFGPRFQDLQARPAAAAMKCIYTAAGQRHCKLGHADGCCAGGWTV